MLHPSYSELMSVVNSGVEEGEQLVVSSRYSIVKATSARAKQIIDARSIEEKVAKSKDKEGEHALTREEKKALKMGEALVDDADNLKPLSVAVRELYEGKITIVGNND
ncbi:MAG: DNA-directed RNA polymerase subunit omega [Lachnospira sp.]